ncbi:non-ribosomal peptide synthetase [Magnetospirillum fulvum]|uniref:Amino acid adenylation domain-containing protein n=1 Tax=Magnetospirillum fulvum TaxID=1082 RepID=A0A1H6JI02_MAGFU|nr:non-ribosomal peptide synthetase [Magnetospirillum fulvum]SEH60429.1 amino acid adenylation domain-containing protein [Magnetospirillum fulvum]
MSNRTAPVRRPSRDEVEAIYPLLPLQQGMLFHDLLSPGDQPYFRQVSFRISSEIAAFDPALCRQVWSALIARHEALRSVFDFENTNRLLRLVLKQGETVCDEEDVSGLDEATQAARIEAFRAEDRRRGFDPRLGPLTRVRLFRLGGGRFEMVWSHAHLILDGWSGSLLLAEFADLYAAGRAGRVPVLAPPPSTRAYFDRIAARDEAESRRFWAELLAGYDRPVGLPRLGPGRPGAPYRPSQYLVTLTPERHAVLEGLAARAGVTLNSVLVALWGILLGRYADSADVVFGSVVSGRTLDVDGIERMVGAVINTIPVRVTLGAGEGIVSLLRRLQAQAFDSLTHDHLPLAEIHAQSGLPDALLDHLLVFENYPQVATEAESGLGFRVVSAEADERANYDFGLIVQPGPPLRIAFAYNEEAHSEAQMRRLGEQIATLIDALAADPEQPVERIEVLGAADLADLAVFSRGARRAPLPDETIVALWRAQVARTPDRPALRWDQGEMSYRELDAQSDRLAAALGRLPGFAAEQAIGVLAGRGWRRIVALLGILKAGGAYLPLTPALPDERLGFILGDTDCRIVLTDTAGQARLEAMRPGIGRVIDQLDATPDGAAATVAPGDLAYILYTSGSTGRPKGVMVEHRGFVNMILGQIEGFGLGPDDRVLQVSSCSFDASLSEIFMALLSGAALVLASAEAGRDRDRLLAAIADHRVTVAGLSPSLLSALDFADFPGLRLLISAGEAVDPASARHYAARLRFINAYGPTEASVCASFHEVRADRDYPTGIPIGRPIPNTAIRILDRFSRPVPIGAVGEICLSGPGLARGYRNGAEPSQSAFVGDGAERLYRTGDLGLWLEDGEIVYRGRRDGQVKLNGRRVELGEIEAALRRLPGIVQAAVIVADAGAGRGGRLVAYVVAAPPPDPDAVRRQLAATLPPYMIPSALVTLPDLPLTLAGKLDRAALPSPPPPAAAADDDPPVTPAEQAVAAAFAAVLGGATIGRHATFQALGGDSLTAIRVVGRLAKQGYALDLADLLGGQSVAAIAVRLTPRQPEAAAVPPASAEAPLTPVQATFFADHREGRAHCNHAILLKAAEPIDDEALRPTLAALWRHHDSLRLRFRIGPDRVTQSAADPLVPPGPDSVDLRGHPDPWGALLADVATRHEGFDLATGPLLAAIIYRLDEGDFLVLLAHHLVTDALSWRFLLDDLAIGYRQARAGAAVVLPPVGASYLDWARALETYRRSEHLAARKPDWDKIDAAPVRPLATDAPMVAHRYDETETDSVDLAVASDRSDSVVQTRLLVALGRALAACGRLGQTRILLSGHGRLPIPGAPLDVGRTTGWFTANYPVLLTEAGADPDPATLGAAALEYGLLRLAAAGGEAKAPVEEITFNYMGRVDLPPEAGAPFAWVPGLDPASVGRLERTCVLEVGASREADRITVKVRYCGRIHRAETIRRLVAAMEVAWDSQP